MDIDRGMGHDVSDKPGRELRNLPLIVAAAVAVPALIVAATVATFSQLPREGVTPLPAPYATASPATTEVAAAHEDGSDEDHDDHTTAGAPQSAWGALGAFMDAWTSTDPRKRAVTFPATTTEQIAEGLAETRPDNVITANRVSVEVVGAGPHSAEFLIRFQDVAGPVRVTLAADPEATYEWKIVAIERTGE